MTPTCVIPPQAFSTLPFPSSRIPLEYPFLHPFVALQIPPYSSIPEIPSPRTRATFAPPANIHSRMEEVDTHDSIVLALVSPFYTLDVPLSPADPFSIHL